VQSERSATQKKQSVVAAAIASTPMRLNQHFERGSYGGGVATPTQFGRPAQGSLRGALWRRLIFEQAN
jgi:hypothetical protein